MILSMSLTQCMKRLKTGVNFGAISNVIKGKGRIAGGYKWIKYKLWQK